MSSYSLTPRLYANRGAPRQATDMKPLVDKPQPPVAFDDPMQHLRNAGTVTMSTELFEKLRLPEKPVPAAPPPMRLPFGNPTPIGVVGMVITVTPLSFTLMGVGGAGGPPSAGIGTFYFFGGMLQLFAGLMEWFLGSTFPSVVFTAYGSFFLMFGAILTPGFAAYAPYAPERGHAALGLESKNFNANLAFIFLWMTVLTVLFLVCSLRTNAVFVVIFAALTGALGSLTTSYFLLSAAAPIRNGRAAIVTAAAAASKAQATSFSVVGGVCALVASMAGWYLLASTLLETLDFPFKLPVGDLSGWIKPRSRLHDDDASTV
ncbi:hypothetical protein MAPG_04913 [Magnaporthiopsis poae ATCC 64411]|uniref:GPR1/FUN34/YaaH-class plasma membrane protein n=1 Tax=Magnaporthiopsis poae (strain ATCC 64411 / 73-15) TaxID=644358 RepID=A0A0C4DY03_MAGP6|nr:hypothetical protein MAPG_04913 [Magnaporthiopsis poae ATCC 64411]